MAVTRKDVAKLAKVSEATVSYVINNTKNVTPQVRKCVLDAVETLDYPLESAGKKPGHEKRPGFLLFWWTICRIPIIAGLWKEFSL